MQKPPPAAAVDEDADLPSLHATLGGNPWLSASTSLAGATPELALDAFTRAATKRLAKVQRVPRSAALPAGGASAVVVELSKVCFRIMSTTKRMMH